MTTWQEARVSVDATIEHAINILTSTGRQICLVCDDGARLLGTVTDGDIRRGLIASMALDQPVSRIMNPDPHTVQTDSNGADVLALMRTHRIHAIPVVDGDGRVVELRHMDDFVPKDIPRDNPVVIMAGGLGTRLRPMTDNLPKPLLRVGNKPLLETIIENFVKFRFHRFYISVNYKADMIKDHFGDGATWNAEISYIEENERLGTAGALRLIPEESTESFIVMNGDLLTQVDFEALLNYHHEQHAAATMCVREYDLQVPFGVVRTDNNQIAQIDEKPVQHFLVNAGIYVLEPELLRLIPDQGAHDMTTLFESIIADGHATAVFPIREYWLDVGRIDDLDQANWAYNEVFRE